MSTTQVVLIIAISALAIGSLFFFISPDIQNEVIPESEQLQEQVQEDIQKPEQLQISKENYIFEEGEPMINYKIVDCYFKSQIPDMVIKQNNKIVTKIEEVPFVVCISAGEKRTGGYSLNLESINYDNENNKILIKLFLKTPEKGEMVTQAFTYPSIGIEINEILKEGDWEIIVKIEQKNSRPIMLTEKFSFLKL